MKRFRIMFFGLVLAASGSVASTPCAAQDGQDGSRPPKLDVEAARPQRWAVLIGVDDYAELPDNRHCSDGIDQLKGRLIASGFPAGNVFVLSDRARQPKFLPSKTNIERQLALIPQLANKNDLLLVAFSGHAVEISGKSFLCPIEAALNAPDETLVATDYVYRKLGGSNAKHKVLIVDAGRRAAGLPKEAVASFLRSLKKTPDDLHVLGGCQPGQTPIESDKLQGSRFMHLLCRGLAGSADTATGNGDRRTSLAELVEYCRREASTGTSPAVPVLYGEKRPIFNIADVGSRDVAADYPTLGSDPVASSARLEAVADVNPQSLAAFNTAVAHFAQQNSSEAIEYCSEAIGRDPGNVWAHILRSSAYCMQGNYAKAVDDYRRLGIPLPCQVKLKKANLMQGEKVLGTVSKGERLYITKANGQWLWVDAVGKDKTRQGWIYQKHVE